MPATPTDSTSAADEFDDVSPGDRPDASAHEDTEPTAGEAFAKVQQNLGELLTYALQYVSATLGGVAFTVKKVVYLAVLGLLAAIVGLTVLVTGSVLAVVGLAEALAAAMPGGWKWVGPLVIGLLIVGGTLIGTYIVIRSLAVSGKSAAAASYRDALLRQRRRFGTDALARAKEAAAKDKHGSPSDVRRAADAELSSAT